MLRFALLLIIGIAVIFGALVVRGESAFPTLAQAVYIPLIQRPSDDPTSDATYTPPPVYTYTPTATATPTQTKEPTATPTTTASPTNTATPTATPTLTATPTITPTPFPTPDGDNVSCVDEGKTQVCAWVSNGAPRQNTNVTAYGRLRIDGKPVVGAKVHTIWHFESGIQTRNCQTGANGVGKCARAIQNATVGYKVVVDVEITYNGRVYAAETYFVPRP